MSPHAEEPRGEPYINGINGLHSEMTADGQSELNGVDDALTTHNWDAANKSHLRRASAEGVYDLICVGFGPANLALAISLHDALDDVQPKKGLRGLHHRPPKVLFLERQQQFGWHRGMLLSGAKMQISFVKDMATLRNPRSEFTFLNYLHKKNRLASFTNLNTFLPQRLEYEDYMKWCAAAFDDVVEYGQEVMQVRPNHIPDPSRPSPVNSYEIVSKDINNGTQRSWSTRNVVVALGGKPQIPKSLPQQHPRVFHSARYQMNVEKVLPDKAHPYTVAVLGCGQSAAEIFDDLQSRYPNARTRLLIRGSALKPSDDSPFVNEIFDPEQIDPFYEQPPELRAAALAQDRGTNYGVVRIGLLEHIYENLYMQRVKSPNPDDWQHKILCHHSVLDAQPSENSIRLRVCNNPPDVKAGTEELMDVDALIVATGYSRDHHKDVLEPVQNLVAVDAKDWSVSRDYRLELDKAKVARGSGIWLTGCNEQTHGLSDTLLSVLATRGDEVARSIFGD